MAQRLGGIIQVQIDGVIYRSKDLTYNAGNPKKEALIGADSVHGYTEKPQVGYIEGDFTDSSDVDLADLTSISDSLVTINLPNGKTFALHHAYYAGDGTVGTAEGNIGIRFEGEGEEI